MSWTFFLTSLVIVFSPGTGVVYTLSSALSRGAKAGIAAAFGSTLGIIPPMMAALLGLAAILHTSALAFQTLKWLGVIYLLYLALQALRESGSLNIEKKSLEKSSLSHLIVKGILINILNPKLSIFFFAFLPQFINQDESYPVVIMFELSLVFMAMTFVVFVFYTLLAAWVRDYVITRPAIMAWLRRAFACSFAALGFKLALSD
jgi:threonine/homoserine/homoserine lactone efflux protein